MQVLLDPFRGSFLSSKFLDDTVLVKAAERTNIRIIQHGLDLQQRQQVEAQEGPRAQEEQHDGPGQDADS